MSGSPARLAQITHLEALEREVIPKSGLNSATHQERPQLVILAGARRLYLRSSWSIKPARVSYRAVQPPSIGSAVPVI